MRNHFLIALPLLLLTGCGSKEQNQSGMATNILDQALPSTRDVPPGANAITPVEPAPDLPIAGGEAADANAMPIALQGRWTGTKESCGDKGAEQALEITAASLVFHESVGTVQRVTPEGEGRLAVVANFTGEGESWTRTLTLRPSADGQQLTIANDGSAIVRKRCTPPA